MGYADKLKARKNKKKSESATTMEGPPKELSNNDIDRINQTTSEEIEKETKPKPPPKPRVKKQTPTEIWEMIKPLLEEYLNHKDNIVIPITTPEFILNPYHKLEAYIISNSNITTRSIGKPKNDQIREINGVRFRLKDFKNWYHIIQMFSEAKELFK